MSKMETIAVILSVFCLLATLFVILRVETFSGFTYTPAFDSGWIDINDDIGQNLTLYHNLSDAEIIVDITGKIAIDGGIHQIHFGLTGYEGWRKKYGGINDDEARSLIQTDDGGYALAGHTWSTAGGYDFLFVKANHNGDIEWSKTYGGAGTEYGGSVIQTTDGGYAISGNTWSSSSVGHFDFWFIKTDAYGNVEWDKTYGGTDEDTAREIVQTSDRGYAIVGYTKSYGAGDYDFWLVKTDSRGNIEWSKTYGGASDDVPNYLVCTNDGGYAMAGYTHSFGAGIGDFWLVKTDSVGNIQWNKTYGGIDSDGAESAIQTSDGGYAIAGATLSFGAGDWDFWFAKTDSDGNMQWNKTYGGGNRDEAKCVIQTVDGGYAIAGFTESFGNGGFDFWLVKTNTVGDVQWIRTFGETKNDSAWSLVQASDGGYVMAGPTQTNSGLYDFCLVKTDVESGLAWTDSTADSITLYRGATDPYWKYVRVRIWKIKKPLF